MGATPLSGPLVSRRSLILGALGGAAALRLGYPRLAGAAANTVSNIFTNPKCANDLSWWTVAIGSVNSGTGTQGLSRVTSDGYTPSTTCAEFSFTPDSSLTGIIVAGRSASYQYNAVVSQGDIVWIRAMAKIVQGTAGGKLQLWSRYENTSSQSSLLQEIDNPPLDEWLSLSGFDIAAYSGTSGSGSLYLEAVLVYVNGDTSPVVLRATNVMMTPNPGAYVDYFDGDGGTSADSGSSFAWSGTPNASSSSATLPAQSTVPSTFLFGLNDGSENSGYNVPVTESITLHTGVGSRVRRLEFDLNDPSFVASDGTPNWSSGTGGVYQSILQACAQAGIKLLPVALGAPSSMNGGLTSNDKAPPLPQYYTQWASICAAIASHLGSSLAATEVWNEPNLTAFWDNGANRTGTGSDGTSRVDPAAYTSLLQATCSAIKAAAPGATVALGGVNGTHDTTATADSLHDWLTAIYAGGAKGNFDVISLHTYPTDPGSGTYQDYGLRSTRAIQSSNNDNKPMWITETGESDGSGGSAVVTTASQQSILVRLIYGMLKRQSDIGAVIPFQMIGSANVGTGTPASYVDGYGWVLETQLPLGLTQYTKQPVYTNMQAEISAEIRK